MKEKEWENRSSLLSKHFKRFQTVFFIIVWFHSRLKLILSYFCFKSYVSRHLVALYCHLDRCTIASLSCKLQCSCVYSWINLIRLEIIYTISFIIQRLANSNKSEKKTRTSTKKKTTVLNKLIEFNRHLLCLFAVYNVVWPVSLM